MYSGSLNKPCAINFYWGPTRAGIASPRVCGTHPDTGPYRRYTHTAPTHATHLRDNATDALRVRLLSPALALPQGGHQLQVARSRGLDVPVAQEEVEHHKVDVGLECVQALGLLWRVLRLLCAAVRQAREGGRRTEGDVAQHVGNAHALEALHLPH